MRARPDSKKTRTPDAKSGSGQRVRQTRRPGGLEYQDLLGGFVRMHILHHAAEGAIYGQWMIDELAHHGYKLSAGTLYPMLHGMETKGYLKAWDVRSGRTYRRFYRATALGRKALAVVRAHLDELFREAGRRQETRAGTAEAAE